MLNQDNLLSRKGQMIENFATELIRADQNEEGKNRLIVNNDPNATAHNIMKAATIMANMLYDNYT